MSQTFTVISSQEPDPVAMAWAISEINPDYWVTIDDEEQVWWVHSPDHETELMVIETPSHVQVLGEDLRLFGTHGGLDITQLEGDHSTYWQDIHTLSPHPEAESAAASFAKLMAHLGLGTCIQHGQPFRHLGEPEETLREEWKS